jgi:nucleoside-diphosphate kinase
VVEPANEFTRSKLEKRVSRALFLVTPAGYTHTGEAISIIEQSGLSISDVRMAQLRLEHLPAVRSFLHRSATATTSDVDHQQQQQLLTDVSTLIEVMLPTSGPSYDQATTALTKAGMLGDAVLVGNVGLEVFVPSGSNVDASLPTTAVLDNCSACLLRPRMVREGRIGELLTAILSHGFEVSAVKLMLLDTRRADEFFQVYRGIYRQYHVRFSAGTVAVARLVSHLTARM